MREDREMILEELLEANKLDTDKTELGEMTIFTETLTPLMTIICC